MELELKNPAKKFVVLRGWARFLSIHALAWTAFVVLCVSLASLWWWEQPTRLKIAVSQHDTDEPKVVQALIDTLIKERADVRLTLQVTNGPEESAQALDRGEVDLAVVRSDIQVGRGATSIMELRKFFPMLVSRVIASIKLQMYAVSILESQRRRVIIESSQPKYFCIGASRSRITGSSILSRVSFQRW
jgi:hypothetical protein